MTRFTTEEVDRWPRLAWVAQCRPGEPVLVRHGRDVEVSDNWFGEVTWDGEFDDGNFDQAEHAFGSGARQRSNGLVFVSSCSVLDRLNWVEMDGRTFISNSLPALMAIAGLAAVPQFRRYPAFFRSICLGLENYQRELPTSGAAIRLVYRKNLVWTGTDLVEQTKSTRTRQLRNFGEYHAGLVECLQSLGENWRSRSRRFPFESLATISTGYDSPTATVLGMSAGLQDTLSITKGRSGKDDDGSKIASQLGLTPHVVQRDDWVSNPASVLPFIAGDAKGEDVYFAGAASLLKRRILLTGYGGTRVWGTKPELCTQFQRGDQSGLSHTEARLHLGYIHLPVPFLIANQTADLRRITHSNEMRPWHVHGEYNCPIARRIVEAAGIERTSFGMEKKAASVLLHDRRSSLPPTLDADFKGWYQSSIGEIGRTRNVVSYSFQRTISKSIDFTQRTSSALARVIPLRALTRFGCSSRLSEFAKYEPMFAHLFPWATERLIENYRID